MNQEERRIFDEIMQPTMSDSMYHLVSFNLDKVWHVIKTEILPHLVTMDYYVVPFIEEARSYNMSHVFVKSYHNWCNKLWKTGRTYKHSTRLPTIIMPHKSDRRCVTRGLTIYESLAEGIPKDYFYETVHHGSVSQVPKTLSLLITGVKKQWCYLQSTKKQITISRTAPGLRKKRTIYVINELILADKLDIKVTIKSSSIKTWEVLGPIPLAFKMIKFHVDKSGILSDVADNILPRSTDAELCAWERPSRIKQPVIKTKNRT